MMRAGRIAVALWVLGGSGALAEGPRVLMLTKSQGFQHPVVGRKSPDELSMAEKIVTELGKKHGFTVTCTKDGSIVTPEGLKDFDVLYFFTQGDIDSDKRNVFERSPGVPIETRDCVMEFVKKGGGFVGTHCGGADTWHNWIVDGEKPFLQMVGGEFVGHGSQQESSVRVVDPKFPAVQGWPSQFKLTDEWYAYDGFHKNMHVLMLLETEGMKEPLYDRDDYPITWCSEYGDGRVFYTGMGHREDVWENPLYQEMVAKGILWAGKKIDADASPNLKELFGDEAAALERINPKKK
jgi:hypothetical protein